MKYKEFDMFTVDQIKDMINYDLGKAMDLFADSYVAIYRIEDRIRQLHDLIATRDDEIHQALELCVKCLKLVETTVRNRE